MIVLAMVRSTGGVTADALRAGAAAVERWRVRGGHMGGGFGAGAGRGAYAHPTLLLVHRPRGCTPLKPDSGPLSVPAQTPIINGPMSEPHSGHDGNRE